MKESVVAALKDHPQVSNLLVAGYLNANLEQPEVDWRENEIAAELAVVLLEDMSVHFFLRGRPFFQYVRIWSILRLRREVRSRTDYILGTDRHIFRNEAV